MYLTTHPVRGELEWLERQIREETHRTVPDVARLQSLRRRRSEAIRRLAEAARQGPLRA